MRSVSWKMVVVLFIVAVILLVTGLLLRADAKSAMSQMQENEKFRREGNTMFSYSHPTLGTPEQQYQFGNALVVISYMPFGGVIIGFWIRFFTRK